MKPNIVALIGSLRKDSVNRSIYNTYQTLSAESLQIDEVPLHEFPFYNADIEAPPKVVVSAAEKIQKADGVIFFSPEYNYSVSGFLKNAIDWLSRQDPQPFAGKPTAIIGASPGAVGTARMQYHLRQIGVFLDMRFLNKPEVMIAGAYSKVQEGKLIDVETQQYLTRHAAQFATFISGK